MWGSQSWLQPAILPASRYEVTPSPAHGSRPEGRPHGPRDKSCPTITSVAPVLETPRLLLRPHTLDDFPATFAMWSDPEVVRFIGGRPFTREEAWARLLRYVGHWTMLGYGMWAVECRESATYVGEVGFFDAKRDMSPPLDAPEVGWVLAPHAHGKGYATEAVRAALAWGDPHFGGAETRCLIHPENRASLRVAEKCAYRELWRTTYKNDPAIILGRMA